MSESMREALTRAMDDAETPPEPTVEAAEPTPATEVEAPSVEAPESLHVTAEATVQEGDTTPTTRQAPAPVQETVEAAPVSWRHGEKAHWGKIPPEARQAVLRREADVQRAMTQTAEARKVSQNLERTLHPYMPLMQKYGVTDPMVAVESLFQTRATLELGSQAQKAQIVAHLVHQFGVDIGALDELLVQGPQAATYTPPAPRFDPRSIPELAPLFGLAEQVQASQAAKVDREIQAVAALPHFESVREDMADLLESANARGRSLSMRQAYDLSVGITQGVAPTPNVSEAAAILAKSRKASGSVSGGPKGSPDGKPQSLRDTIVAAMGS